MEIPPGGRVFEKDRNHLGEEDLVAASFPLLRREVAGLDVPHQGFVELPDRLQEPRRAAGWARRPDDAGGPEGVGGDRDRSDHRRPVHAAHPE